MVERFTLTDDLDGVMERVVDSNRKNESVFCAPVSFFGKSRVAENARFLHAFAIDLDGVGVQELKNMLKQFRNGRDPKFAADKWVSLPQPTFLVNSGTGFHLYYVLDQPIPLIPRIVPFVQEIKAMLTDYIWRDTVSTLEDVQHQGIYQPFRMPGTPTKLNGKAAGSKIKDKYEAVAFVHNGDDGKPWRCSLDYLLGYAGVRGGKDRAELIELMRTAGRTPIERAKKLWPEWYQARIVEGKATGRWTCKRDLYDWWLGEVKTKATDHHRYWCLNVLAAYAKKCGIPYEELEADALALVPTLEDLTEREDNHFTEEHALAAIEAYYDPIIHKLTRDRIERRTAIELPKNKRNGRPRKQHVEVMNAVREIESRLDSLVSNIAEIAHAFALKIFDRPFQVLESVADNPVIDSRAFRAAVERARESLKPRDERKAVDAAAKAVKAEMQRLAPELDGLAAEARDMRASEHSLDTGRSRGGEQVRPETLSGDSIG